eukprot:SAG31_NODE_93_length_26250_cov_47.615082_6_plen_460_part_00
MVGARKMEELRAATAGLRRDVSTPKPTRIVRGPSPRTPASGPSTSAEPRAANPSSRESLDVGAAARRGVMARLVCISEGWLYDMVEPFITLGRQLPNDDNDPSFCHMSDADDVLPEHFAVICENPYAKVKRFSVEVLDAAEVDVNGVDCTKATGPLPLSGRDIIKAAGLDIIFVLAPSGEAALRENLETADAEEQEVRSCSPLCFPRGLSYRAILIITRAMLDSNLDRGHSDPQVASEEWSRNLVDPILASAADRSTTLAISAAAWYGTLCADDGSVFRLRKTNTAVGAETVETARGNKTDCIVRAAAGRGLISCKGAASGGSIRSKYSSPAPAAESYTIRCATKDYALLVNGVEHSALDGPLALHSQDVIGFRKQSVPDEVVEVTFCTPGDMPHTLHNRAATRIQAAFRGFLVRTDGPYGHSQCCMLLALQLRSSASNARLPWHSSFCLLFVGARSSF